MRKVLFALFMLVAYAATSQDLNAEIGKEFNLYAGFLKSRDFDKVLNYTHPSLFESYPREQVKQGLEQMFNNPQMQIQMGDPELSGFSPLKEIAGKFYVPFTNKQATKMRFEFIETQSGTDKENSVNTLKQNLTTQFGEGTVSYDAQTGFFTINATSKMLAYSEDKKTWKFVDVGNAQFKPILEKFIPAEFFN